jgi:TM2 domain-containing membrane protein YozV
VPPPYGQQPPSGEQPPYGQQAPYGQQPYGQPPYGQVPSGYPPPGGVPYGAGPGAPYGVHPVTGMPYSDKTKLVAGLLQIFLGGFGVGRFYLGDNKTAIWQIVVTVLTCGLGSIWGLVDGIIILATDNVTDAQGRPLRMS